MRSRKPAPTTASAAVESAESRGQSEIRTANHALEEALAREQPPPDFAAPQWEELRAFYAQRQNMPAWIDGGRAGARVDQALAVLATASNHGLRVGEYHVDDVDRARPLPESEAANLELRLTAALLTLGRDVATDARDPRAVGSRSRAERRSPDLPATLAKAVEDGTLDTWLDRVAPPHAEYAALKNALAELRDRATAGGWTSLPESTLREPDASAIAERLRADGDDSIEAFQSRHGLEPTGKVDRGTLKALNVPVDERIRQIELNLERWRSMPDVLGERYVFVNIPQFALRVMERHTQAFESRVVVGKHGDETPIFSAEMNEVVFSPYWNIPNTIKTDETLPAIAKDPDYLRRQNLEIVQISGGRAKVIDPSSVDWNDERVLRGLSFRQRPGASNALGLVKFLFPNEFDVYIHDTPSVSLFRRTGRAFSHGCVRVQDPRGLAQYVLRDQPEWTPDAIDQAMRAGTERHVRLSSTIPVHIVYFTVWVGADKRVHFENDVYGYDKKVSSS